MLAYLKFHNKFLEDISVARSLSSEDIFKFSDIVEIKEENESITEKIFQMEKRGLGMLLLKIPQTFTDLHQMRHMLFLRLQI